MDQQSTRYSGNDHSIDFRQKMRLIFSILKRNKWLITGLVGLFLILAQLYNTFTTPVYETITVLKKENDANRNRRASDPLSQVVGLRTFDEINTEIRIIKSRTVLEKTVKALNLYAFINTVSHPQLSKTVEDLYLTEYQAKTDRQINGRLPSIKILDFYPETAFTQSQYRIRISGNQKVQLFAEDESIPLTEERMNHQLIISLPEGRILLKWEKPVNQTEIIFTLENPVITQKKLAKQIGVTALRKTSIIEVAVRASSAYMAQRIANTVTKKFRETRLEQKRQILKDSYQLVEERLSTISKNLKKKEEELSRFKSANQLIKLDQTSQEMLSRMSSIESKKIETELRLSEFQARYNTLKAQLAQKGYFDQTYLNPSERSENRETPFSELLRKLNNAELKRLELLQRRTETHPDVITLDERISEIKKNLAQYNQNTLDAYLVILQALTEKKAELDSMLAKYSRQISQLPGQQKQLMNLTRHTATYEKMFNLLMNKREEMKIAELSKLQDIVVVDNAFFPMKPKLPRRALNLFIAGILGGMLALTIVLFRTFFNRTVQDLHEVETRFHIPILAIFPAYHRKIRKKLQKNFKINHHFPFVANSHFGYREAFRILQARLDHYAPDRKIFMITSCEPGTGKTSILNHFAISLALAGKRVLVIDCDLRRPRTGEFYNLPLDKPGLIAFLKNGILTPNVYKPVGEFADQDIVLDVIPAGGAMENSNEIIGLPKFQEYLTSIAPHYDYVLIDTPPANWTVDTLILGKFVRDAILIIQPDFTNRDALHKAVQEFEGFGINVIGSVINKCDFAQLGDRYRLGYGGNYYGPQYGQKDRLKMLPGPRI